MPDGSGFAQGMLKACTMLPARICEGTSDMATILIIDDNADYRQPMTEALEISGHQVIEAGNSTQALEMLSMHGPDVCLCDVDLPGMDGFAILAHASNQPRTAHTKFIMVSGYPADALRVRARNSGAVAVLTKPVPLIELLSLIDQIASTD